MKLKKINGFIVLVLTVLLMVCACSKNNNESDYPADQEMKNTSTSDSIHSEEAGYIKGELIDDTSLPSDRKIIRNASLEIEASDAAALYGQLGAFGNESGGYEFSYNISNHEEYSVINAVFKIPPEKLNAFVNFAGENGKVINSSLSSEDITDNYFDMQTRLETKRKSLERYYELLKSADTIDGIIQLQKTIDSITLEIESYEGKLKLWNNLVDMATVEIYIRQYNDPITIRKEINWNTLTLNDMGYLIKRGFVSLVNIIVSFLQWVFIAVLVSSPVWVIILCILFVMRKKKKNRRDIKKSLGTGNSDDKSSFDK